MRPDLPVGAGAGAATEAEREITRLLYEAIPEKELARLRQLPIGRIENGGIIRGNWYMTQVVASYNNTRKDQQEIIEWFERALIGVRAG